MKTRYRPAYVRTRRPRTQPDATHGPVMGTLAGAAPPWMETWATPVPASALDLRRWPTSQDVHWAQEDWRQARQRRVARRFVTAVKNSGAKILDGS